MSIEKAYKLVTVLCACIRREGGQQVLLSMRHAPGVPGLDGKWELPGGKIEFGETPEQALVREIREEIGMEVTPLRLLPYLHTNVWEYEHAIQQVVLACYECEPKDGSEPNVCDEVRWADIDSIDFNLTLPGTKDFVSLALRNDWFDKLFIQFQQDKANNQFALAAQPTLFSRYGLIMYSGRVGHWARHKHEEFTSPREMDSRIVAITKWRISRGYKITNLAGPVQSYQGLGKVMELAREKHALAEEASAN